MGKRGPKPKPTELRVLEGNPSKRPLNAEEPKASGEAVCPAHLSEDAAAIWAVIMESLPPGLISAADMPLLAAYCEAWSAHKAAVEALQRDRDLIGGNLVRNDKPSPYLRIMDQTAKTMASLSTRLGLSPADRSGLKLGDQRKGDSKWGDLIA